MHAALHLSFLSVCLPEFHLVFNGEFCFRSSPFSSLLYSTSVAAVFGLINYPAAGHE